MPKSNPSWADLVDSVSSATIDEFQKLSSVIPNYSYLLSKEAALALAELSGAPVAITNSSGEVVATVGAAVGGSGTGTTAFTLGTKVDGEHATGAYNTEEELDEGIDDILNAIDSL